MIYERWDVVLVPFPYLDLPLQKKRPAVVLPHWRFNMSHGCTIAAMVTTANGGPWPTDVPVGDLAEAGLRHACYVRWKIFSVPNAAIIRKLGSIAAADRMMNLEPIVSDIFFG
jgi:mRNA interferase MazF